MIVNGHKARLGAPERAHIADGAKPVAKPSLAGQCWGCSRGGFAGGHFRCDKRARADKLTCIVHKKLELPARYLRATLATQAAADGAVQS